MLNYKQIVKEKLIKIFFTQKSNFISNKWILNKIGIRNKFLDLYSERKGKIKNNNPIKIGEVLFLRMRFVPRFYSLEIVLANSFRKFGFESKFLACNSKLNICSGWDYRNEVIQNQKNICNICEFNNLEISKLLDYPVSFLSEYISTERSKEIEKSVTLGKIDDLKDLWIEGIYLKDELYLTVAKFLFKGQLNEADYDYCNRFYKSATILVVGFIEYFKKNNVDIVVMNCGHIFWYGIAYKILSSLNKKIITYDETNIGVTNLTWTFDASNPCVDYNWNNEWDSFKETELADFEVIQINHLLQTRKEYFLYERVNTMVNFDDSKSKKYGLTISLFTNVLWDSTVVGKNSVYENGLVDWVKHTIEIIEKYPDVRLIIRIHPAEKVVYGMRSRENVIEELLKWKTDYKENIIFIESESKINSYEIVKKSDVILVYATNLGLEAVFENKLVVTSGPAHFRNKGFTIDPNTPLEFENILNSICEHKFHFVPNIDLAKKYAFLAFIKTQNNLNLFKDENPHTVTDFECKFLSDKTESVEFDNLINWMINGSGYYLKN